MNELNFKDYKGLNKTNEYDRERAELLAEAVTERITLQKRIDYIDTLIDENKELKPFLWTTLKGECKPLHKLDDDHLTNILSHVAQRNGQISPQLRAEAISRDIAIPDPAVLYEKRMNNMLEAQIIDHDDIFGLDD